MRPGENRKSGKKAQGEKAQKGSERKPGNPFFSGYGRGGGCLMESSSPRAGFRGAEEVRSDDNILEGGVSGGKAVQTGFLEMERRKSAG